MFVCQKMPIFNMLLLYFWVKLKHTTLQIAVTILCLTNFILTYSCFLRILIINALILLNDRLLASTILSWQILLYQYPDVSINFVSSLILYNKV